MKSKSREFMFDADRPLGPEGSDRLGFRQVAERLSVSILSRSPSDGYVAAVQGSWGSGKSTLIGFLEGELKRNGTETLKVVRFQPWIVGNRQGMLNELMGELSSVVAEMGLSDGISGKGGIL